MFKAILSGLLMLMLMAPLSILKAESSNVFKREVSVPMEKVYPAIYKALEDARFFVVFEPEISNNLKRFSERWGANYNRNQLSSIRSMVFCNAWYANEVSNADPDMLSLCPLRIGLYEKQGKSYVVFARPSVIAATSPAKRILLEVEQDVIKAINTGLKAF